MRTCCWRGSRRGDTDGDPAGGGATRRQIVGLALTESVVGDRGCLVGLAVAMGAARLLLLLAFQHVQFLPVSVTPSPAVLVCAVAVALVTGILFAAPVACNAHDPAEASGSGRAISAHSSWASKA